MNERVGAGNWDDGDELGDTWVSRNAFSYGRGGERGTARPEVLRSLLKTTDRIVQVGVGVWWWGWGWRLMGVMRGLCLSWEGGQGAEWRW